MLREILVYNRIQLLEAQNDAGTLLNPGSPKSNLDPNRPTLPGIIRQSVDSAPPVWSDFSHGHPMTTRRSPCTLVWRIARAVYEPCTTFPWLISSAKVGTTSPLTQLNGGRVIGALPFWREETSSFWRKNNRWTLGSHQLQQNFSILKQRSEADCLAWCVSDPA